MKVSLAGYNVDADWLDILTDSIWLEPDPQSPSVNTGELPVCSYNYTPEAIAAAYARISRKTKSLEILRKEARDDLSKAQTSCEDIVFGMGHASVQEHAFLQFDIEGVSLIAVEALQHSRLASYMQRSYRYCGTPFDYYTPLGLWSSMVEDEYLACVKVLHETYLAIRKRLRKFHIDRGLSKKDAFIAAQEDARYVTPMASLTSLAMSINARSLCSMIRRLLVNGRDECGALGEALLEVSGTKVSSLIRHVKATEYQRNLVVTPERMAEASTDFDVNGRWMHCVAEPLVELCNEIDGACHVARAELFMRGSEDYKYSDLSSGSYPVIDKALRGLQSFDALPRSFELLGPFIFQVELSGAAYDQLKRHRMATVIPQQRTGCCGVTMPPIMEEAGCVDLFSKAAFASAVVYKKMRWLDRNAAEYILLHGHRLRALISMNARELYHFCRLRMDANAQWEIRSVASQMAKLAVQAVSPENAAVLQALCGKDEFETRTP
jgi:thymidylate synthase ThyX